MHVMHMWNAWENRNRKHSETASIPKPQAYLWETIGATRNSLESIDGQLCWKVSNARILSLSLGASRDFCWRLQGTLEMLGTVPLGDGDVATMEGLA